jgi:hypothetical protein
MSAKCRCLDHRPKNKRNPPFTHFVIPVGFPKTSICGKHPCSKPGFLFLKETDISKDGHNIYGFGGRDDIKVTVLPKVHPILDVEKIYNKENKENNK